MDLWIYNTPPPPANRRLAYGPEQYQFGDLRLPRHSPGPYPVALVIHGGFWRSRYDLEPMGHFCQALTEQGFATWNIEYRRIGNNGGGWPGTLSDTAMAADYLREIGGEYQLDLQRVVALGHSAGGHLALWLAGRSQLADTDYLYNPDPLKLKGVISLAGVSNLRRGFELKLSDNVVESFLGGPPEKYPERYYEASPYELLPVGIPQVLIHGTADADVPYTLSQEYYEKAEVLGEPVKLITLPETGHFEIIDPKSTEWAVIVENTLALSDSTGKPLKEAEEAEGA